MSVRGQCIPRPGGNCGPCAENISSTAGARVCKSCGEKNAADITRKYERYRNKTTPIVAHSKCQKIPWKQGMLKM